MGSQEAKRERQAASSPVTLNLQRDQITLGCGVVLVAYVGACLLLFSFTGWRLVVAFALPALILVASWLAQYLYGLVLLLTVRRRWSSEGIRCLVVYSNSPNWEAHIRENWLSRFGHVAVTLNWSDRALWESNLAVRIFRRFCEHGDFNPAVVVFQGLGHPLVFRFYRAFKQVKAGRPEYLQRLEDELIGSLDLADGSRRPNRWLE